MKCKALRFGKGFRVAFDARRAQAAEMVIAPGDSEGGPDNRHRGADQWLYVVAGTGLAIVGDRRKALKAGSLLVIERASAMKYATPGGPCSRRSTSTIRPRSTPTVSRFHPDVPERWKSRACSPT